MFSETETKIRERITAYIEANPGCSTGSVTSEIRSEFKVGAALIVKAMMAEGIIRCRSNNLYMVED